MAAPPAGVAANQQRTFAKLLGSVLPHLGTDQALPARIESHLRSNRSLGSRDRRLYRELLYTTVRFYPWLEAITGAAEPEPIAAGAINVSLKTRASGDVAGGTARFKPAEIWLHPAALAAVGWLSAELPFIRAYREAHLAAWPACPPTIAEKATILTARFGIAMRSLFPAWVPSEAPIALDPTETDALHRRAPLWIRLRSAADEPAVLSELTARGWPLTRTSASPLALRINAEADLTRTDTFAAGRFEIQDLGSQLILAHRAITPGARWLDACAGAGGKTLQLAALLGSSGTIVAHDPRPAALTELKLRAARAGCASQITLSSSPSGTFDGILIDAPCTGTGTWRRSPHLKYSTSVAAITSAAALQVSLLRRFAPLVRPGGRLIYSTCSLCPRENEATISGFLSASSEFTPESADTIRPSAYDTDGFFVASLRRVH